MEIAKVAPPGNLPRGSAVPAQERLEAKITAARPVTAQEIKTLVALYAEWAGGYGKAPVGQFGATYAMFRMGGR